MNGNLRGLDCGPGADDALAIRGSARSKNPLGIGLVDLVADEHGPSLIHTLGVVARARGMMKLAKETGITRAGLYKALSPKGNPSFETVAKIVGEFGMRLSAQVA